MNKQEKKIKQELRAGAARFHKDFNDVLNRTTLEKKLSFSRNRTKTVWVTALASTACVLIVGLYLVYTHFFKKAETNPIIENSRTKSSSAFSDSKSADSTSNHVAFEQTEVDIKTARELFDIRLKEPEHYKIIYVLYDSNGLLRELVYQFDNGTIILRKGDYSDEIIPQCNPKKVGDKTFYESKSDPMNVFYFRPGFIFEAQFAGINQAQIINQIDKIIF